MAWKVEDGVRIRYPRYFNSHAESQAACIAIWKKSYGYFPDLALAKKWTGGDSTQTWLDNVTAKYNSL